MSTAGPARRMEEGSSRRAHPSLSRPSVYTRGPFAGINREREQLEPTLSIILFPFCPLERDRQKAGRRCILLFVPAGPQQQSHTHTHTLTPLIVSFHNHTLSQRPPIITLQSEEGAAHSMSILPRRTRTSTSTSTSISISISISIT